MINQPETITQNETKFPSKSWQVAKWAFQSSLASKSSLLDILEIDLPEYIEPSQNNISRFRGHLSGSITKPYFVESDLEEQTWIEQGAFLAGHFRYEWDGQFYDSAMASVRILQGNHLNSSSDR